ncbi:MAG TPA: transglutaminase-like domain-containing protein [Clostridia bacterium]
MATAESSTIGTDTPSGSPTDQTQNTATAAPTTRPATAAPTTRPATAPQTAAPTAPQTAAPTAPQTAAPTAPQTAAPTVAASGAFPYVNFGATYNNAYTGAAATASSADGKASVSMSQAANGVILARVDNVSAACKALVTTPAGSQFQYILSPGKWLGVPCNGGSGSYTVMLLENVEGSTYLPLLNQAFSVSLGSALKPFTAASILTNFGSGSTAIQTANSLCAGVATTDGKVAAVYSWIISHITYNSALASQISSGAVTTYIPDIEGIMSTRKGICFDYAALMAAMLRSQGVPTKLVMGTVPQGYHAWNEVYFQGTGWVVVSSFKVKQVSGSAYVMFDTTFGAGGMTIDGINAVSRTVQKTY